MVRQLIYFFADIKTLREMSYYSKLFYNRIKIVGVFGGPGVKSTRLLIKMKVNENTLGVDASVQFWRMG